MQILALVQQAQVQRAAQEALQCLDERSSQAEAASEQQQELDLKVHLMHGPGNFVDSTLCRSIYSVIGGNFCRS